MHLIEKVIENIKNNTFLRSVLMIASGTALAQFITTLVSPIITRVFTPEEYGVYTSYLAISTILSSIGSLNYEKAIPIAENRKSAINVIALCFIVLLVFVGMVTCLLLLFETALLEFLDQDFLKTLIFWLPFGLFFIGVYRILSEWAFRERNYKVLSKIPITQSILGNITKLSLGIPGFGSVSLVIGAIIQQSAGITNLLFPFFKKNKSLIRQVNRTNIYINAKRFKDFPIFQTPAILLDRLGIQLPVILITAIYGKGVVGYYGLAWSIVHLPTSLIGRSISNVFYAEAANMRHKSPEMIKNLSDNLIKKLLVVGLIPLFVLVLFAPVLFTLIFGDDWYQAGVYARMISAVAFSNLVFNSVSRVYEIYERQKEKLLLNLIRLILVITVFGIAAITGLGSYWTVGIYTLVISIMYLVTYLIAQNIMKEEASKTGNALK